MADSAASRRRHFAGLLRLAVALAFSSQSWAADNPHPLCNGEREQAVDDREAPAGLRFFPRGTDYPPYLADPDRPGTAMLWMQVSDEAIADTGSTRINLKAGGSFGIYRWRSRCPERAAQLDLLGGFDAQFDADNSYDSIGWEGNYGLAVSRPVKDRLVLRLGVLHTSSHIGDELVERTGRQRIGYTREELLLGGRWLASGRLTLYAEVGRAHDRRNEAQEPWRWQAGAEYEIREAFLKRRAGWYGALNLAAWEERDYRVDTTLHLGVSVAAGDRRWRLGVEIHDGRPNLGEFFQDTESYAALGLWLEP